VLGEVGLVLRAELLLLLLCAVSAGVAGCRSSSGPADSATAGARGPQIRITFAGEAGAELEASGVRVTGNVESIAELVSGGGGRVSVEAVDLSGVPTPAARFPSFAASPGAPASAILVRSRGIHDELDPGERDFTFGAEVSVDAASESDAVGSADNGNNVVQKGLFLDSSQFKLQIDHGFASCRVAGTEGDLSVRSQVMARPEVWYRLQCARTADGITLTVFDLSDEAEMVDRQVERGVTGDVDTAHAPDLSVGAKVGSQGAIPVSSTDQFNGRIATVFLDIRGYEHPSSSGEVE
jgi:hypothetical protein